MSPLNLLIASLNFTRAETLSGGLFRFVAERSLTLYAVENVAQTWSWNEWWTSVLQWLSRPDVLAAITAWWITFTIVITIIMSLGFGPAGVVAGSLAAGFQSFMYSGFTPAGGIFATLTSMAMLGTLMFPAALVAFILATGVSALVWSLGVGK
ncbi:uncharacterized protein P174DRAFT_445899 [Aspergillus novofumigatus IBT 16806]|uniref:Uncharacterized protein n=1 Tax=Aspergillus novofumigatus (strain IBT 16806) TaxID=1392255 RepID=A0A2I1BVE1_ASPN1|nr:uncharacterized protein P174DRAFT_445899 [Aspergillus novofumigatus IBT 16806]PKX89357.1 hypothetical protein P174DRAFT_445899 [Aspergillus novofumigatus IBT 16806]